jgi:hypothetical protein
MKETAIACGTQTIVNAVCFFSQAHDHITGECPLPEMVFAYLATIDFGAIAKRGRLCFGLAYVATGEGPRPVELSPCERGGFTLTEGEVPPC